jgi:hypothetical protein
MTDNEDDWSDAERAALDALEPAAIPPPQLEARVVAALKGEGLIRARRPSLPWLPAAAALLALALGFGVGRATARRGATPPESRTFMLLLYPGAAMDPSPAAEQARVQEYGQWARGLRARGQYASGEKLTDEARVIGGTPDASASSLQGFFVIRAGSLDEAERIARSCPHRGHGGTIVLREVDPT